MSTSVVAGDALADRSVELSDRLAELLEKYDVPGAAFALARGDKLVVGAAGVLSRATGMAATPDSWFQIGSITKVFTATLVMQLVDEGRVDLDEPVRTYLPNFDVGDDAASRTITVRHLLTHTSGIQGDYFADFGRGDDAVRRYVASLSEVGMLHRPGQLLSYCNSGFCVLGLLLQTLRGADYDSILTERLLSPLGIAGGTLAEQAMLHRAAVGHVPGPDGGPAVPAAQWAMPHSAGPAGSTPFMAPAGLVAFARMHLAGGLAPDGTRLLSQAAVAEMQRRQVAIPNLGSVRGVGASWILYGWGEEVVPGHDGGTLGQFSFLRVHPPTGSIVVLLTNGTGAGQLFESFAAPLFAELTGLPAPDPVVPLVSPPAIDAARLAGAYAHHGVDLRVSVESGRITLTASQHPDAAVGEPGKAEEFVLVPYSQSTSYVALVSAEPVQGAHLSVMFPAAESTDQALAESESAGPPAYLRFGSRVFVRTGG